MANWDADQAEWYAQNWGDHPTHHLTLSQLGIREDDVVVDLGCGSGTMVRLAAELAIQGHVWGIDPTPAMIDIAMDQTIGHDAIGRISYSDGSASRIPVGDGEATLVLAVHSLHHWEDVVEGFVEILRALAPAGRLAIVEENVSGRCGQGHGPLADPDAVVNMLNHVGFADATHTEVSDGDVRAIIVSATKPCERA